MKIFVGNLEFGATEESIHSLFAPHGTVESVHLVMDRETGRSRGFAFVEMPEATADQAITALNGTKVGGRALGQCAITTGPLSCTLPTFCLPVT
jgi:RNA recognition motif-containing protein